MHITLMGREKGMRIAIGLCIGIGLANSAWANDSFSSEFSHAVGGALVASASTVVADRFWPEHRASIGFTVGGGFVSLPGTVTSGSGVTEMLPNA